MKRLTTEEFIEKAKKVHGEKYDYSKTSYTKSSQKVCVICPEHGEFWQVAASHLQGSGCPECARGAGGRARLSFTREEFLKRSREAHGDKYDYTNTVVGAKEGKVKIICPIHGEFEQIARIHMEGGQCPRCRYEQNGKKLSMGWNGFLERAKKKHGNRYIYPEDFPYKNNYDKIPITCRKHGVFYQDAAGHLVGHGCPQCDKETHGNKSKNQEELINRFIERSQKVHGDEYDYSQITKFERYDRPVPIVCRKHGKFEQRPSNHVHGSGCPLCGDEQIAEKKLMGVQMFIEKCSERHSGKYDYSKVDFTKLDEKTTIICPIHGEFVQTAVGHLHGQGCPKCANQLSRGEEEINEFIQKLGLETKSRVRDIIKPYEIDIVVPDKKIGFEFDGLMWHSEQYTDKRSLLKKTNLASDIGYRLIHIFEDEWNNKRDIVKSRISSILGVPNRKIFARKCDVRKIEPDVSRKFVNENHLQGNVNASYRYGLFYKEELVAVMTFGKLRISLGQKSDDGVFELLRFCTKCGVQVVGGAGKLLKSFVKEILPHKIVSYADKRWSTGKLYESLGFTYIGDSAPNYFYIIGKKRENRFKFRKDRLVAEGFDPTKSEHEIMLERKIYRIYDCGAMKFEKTYSKKVK